MNINFSGRDLKLIICNSPCYATEDRCHQCELYYVPLTPSQLSFWNSASMNSVQSSQILSISLFLKESFHRHSNKPLSSLFSKNHLYPLMISTTFVQFQTSTLFPKFSKKLLPPAFNLTCLLILCLPLFNLLIGSFILLKLLFSKFTMTSS